MEWVDFSKSNSIPMKIFGKEAGALCEYEDAFNLFCCQDGNGFINRSELACVMSNLGETLKPEEIQVTTWKIHSVKMVLDKLDWGDISQLEGIWRLYVIQGIRDGQGWAFSSKVGRPKKAQGCAWSPVHRGLYYSLFPYNHSYKKLLYFIKNSSIL